MFQSLSNSLNIWCLTVKFSVTKASIWWLIARCLRILGGYRRPTSLRLSKIWLEKAIVSEKDSFNLQFNFIPIFYVFLPCAIMCVIYKLFQKLNYIRVIPTRLLHFYLLKTTRPNPHETNIPSRNRHSSGCLLSIKRLSSSSNNIY